MIAGTVPQFLRDPSDHPVTGRLEATGTLPVSTHLSVPLVFSDGTVYGAFCGFTHEVVERLDERSLDAVRLLARMVAGHLEKAEDHRRAASRRTRQPSCATSTGRRTSGR